MRRTNVRLEGIPGEESVFKEVIENFPNPGKELDTQVYEANRPPYLSQCKKTFSKTHQIKTVKSQW